MLDRTSLEAWNRRIWHRHSGAGQVHATGEPLQAPLPDEVLEHEGEGRNLDERRSFAVGPKQVDRLRRSARRRRHPTSARRLVPSIRQSASSTDEDIRRTRPHG